MTRLPPLLAITLILGAGVTAATPSPAAEPGTNETAANTTTIDVDALLEGIDDSDGDGVPDDHDLAPYHPGIEDRSDLNPRGGGQGLGFGAAVIALLAAAGLALRRG